MMWHSVLSDVMGQEHSKDFCEHMKLLHVCTPTLTLFWCIENIKQQLALSLWAW